MHNKWRCRRPPCARCAEGRSDPVFQRRTLTRSRSRGVLGPPPSQRTTPKKGARAAASLPSPHPATISWRCRRDAGAAARLTRVMVIVQPFQLCRAQHVHVDQAAVDRRQRQRLECIHRLLGAGDVGADDEFEVLDPDAVGIGLVVAGLVGKDHAALQRRGAELEIRRAFMHREIAADAVACRARNRGRPAPDIAARVSCAPVVPSRKIARAIAMCPRGTRVKRSRISSDGVPIAIVRVTSVVPSSYCAAGIDQQEVAGRNPPVAPAGDAVVHDGAVRLGAGDGRDETSFSAQV